MKLQVLYVTELDLEGAYLGQSEPQPVDVQLDLHGGVLTAGYDPRLKCNESDWASSYIKTWTIPLVPASQIKDLLDEIAPLAQVAVAAYDTVEGNDPLHEVADITAEGVAALNKIGEVISARFPL